MILNNPRKYRTVPYVPKLFDIAVTGYRLQGLESRPVGLDPS
jgi:hypothetical protein